MTVDPDGRDDHRRRASDNMDCVPGGLNTFGSLRDWRPAASACSTTLMPRSPTTRAVVSRVEVLLRDGCVVGRPRYPAGTSVATTNVN